MASPAVGDSCRIGSETTAADDRAGDLAAHRQDSEALVIRCGNSLL